jgi:exonuclease III
MRIVSWNLAHQTYNRPLRDGFLPAIAQLRPDVLLLNEYVHGTHASDFETGLRQLGLTHHLVSNRLEKNNQVLIASRHELQRGDLTGPETESKGGESNFLHVRIPKLDVEVVGVRVPAYQDEAVLRKYWEDLTTLISRAANRRIVFAGDFNADPESEHYIGGKYLAHLSWKDWAISEADGESFYTGSRLDHALVSSGLAIKSSAYLRELDGKLICGPGSQYVSDHAALSVDIDLQPDDLGASEIEAALAGKTMEEPVPLANRGSQRWLQLAVNSHPERIDSAIRTALNLPSMAKIEWLSPLAKERFLEYRDYPALKRLGLKIDRERLRDFWPAGGPMWDGLARTSTGDVLLVEAKAHISELVSGGSRASAKSLQHIRKSLAMVQEKLAVGGTPDWCGPFYQYANRLAHLQFLRDSGVRAHLLFVYFLNAQDVFGPSSKDEYLGAIKVIEAALGLRRDKLSRYVHKLFIDVSHLQTRTDVASPISLGLKSAGQELIT